jgi:hypothetical protein
LITSPALDGTLMDTRGTSSVMVCVVTRVARSNDMPKANSTPAYVVTMPASSRASCPASTRRVTVVSLDMALETAVMMPTSLPPRGDGMSASL